MNNLKDKFGICDQRASAGRTHHPCLLGPRDYTRASFLSIRPGILRDALTRATRRIHICRILDNGCGRPVRTCHRSLLAAKYSPGMLTAKSRRAPLAKTGSRLTARAASRQFVRSSSPHTPCRDHAGQDRASLTTFLRNHFAAMQNENDPACRASIQIGPADCKGHKRRRRGLLDWI
jgi:hypothetical protein